jgi:hypothetical protein
MDLLTTYTHHSGIQVITAPPLISTDHKSLHVKSSPACSVNSRSLTTASNGGDSSASRSQVLSSQPPVQNSVLNWQLTINCIKSKSKTKSHYDWRSVSQYVLVSNPIWGSWPDIYYCFTVTVLFLYMLLALASAVFLGSESLGTRDHILLSQIWGFPFRRLLRLAGSRWRYSTPPPHGLIYVPPKLVLTGSSQFSSL